MNSIAVKKVKTEQTDASIPVGVESNRRPCGYWAKQHMKEDALIVGKNEFVLFMVEVINCSSQTNRNTEKIKIIVRAAEKYLGLEC